MISKSELEHIRALELAEAFLELGDSASLLTASTWADRALDHDMASSDAWVLKCRILSVLGDHIAALAAVEMATKSSVTDPYARYWRAVVLGRLRRHEDAIKTLDAAIAMLPLLGDHDLTDLAYDEKAENLTLVGRQDDAISTCVAGLTRCPSSTLLKESLARHRRSRVRARLRVLRGGSGGKPS